MRNQSTRESSAWQYLANKLDMQGSMSPHTLCSVTPVRCLGLCSELVMLEARGIIGRELRWQMEARIDVMQREREATGARPSSYLWPEGQVQPRIIAAQLFALLAKQEEREA